MNCEHDYDNPIRLGRANYACPKCNEDITLDMVYIYEQELALSQKDKS